MATQLERLVKVMQGLQLIEATYGREMPHLKREVAELIRLTREDPTASLPAGMLCAGPDVWGGDDDSPVPAMTHQVAPPPDGFACHDEPPSKPA